MPFYYCGKLEVISELFWQGCYVEHPIQSFKCLLRTTTQTVIYCLQELKGSFLAWNWKKKGKVYLRNTMGPSKNARQHRMLRCKEYLIIHKHSWICNILIALSDNIGSLSELGRLLCDDQMILWVNRETIFHLTDWILTRFSHTSVVKIIYIYDVSMKIYDAHNI